MAKKQRSVLDELTTYCPVASNDWLDKYGPTIKAKMLELHRIYHSPDNRHSATALFKFVREVWGVRVGGSRFRDWLREKPHA